MKDLTQGSIRRHIIAMAAPITIGMLVQTLYFMVDLYFVAGLGTDAVAGVSAAGAAVILVMALTQMLSVGTVSLMSRAAGAKDRAAANRVFNQSMLLASACMVLTFVGGGIGAAAYMRAVSATPAITQAGTTYLLWYLPGLALQFAMTAIGAALQGTGIAKPVMVVRMLSVLANLVLAPILIAGWGTHHPLGVAGAGLATTLSMVVGVVLAVVYFVRLESYVAFDFACLLRVDWSIQKRLLQVGLPAGGEFFLMFVLSSVIYTIIRGFGEDAQAGFGIGSRVMQAIFMPAMAVAFAVPAVAGQNFGAGHGARVRETLKQALLIEFVVMGVMVIVCQAWPEVPVGWFTTDPRAALVGATYLRIVSWNFFAAGIIFGCSGIFQALGNTWPSLASSATRLVTFVLPALALSHRSGFELATVWHLSVATTIVQAVVSLALVRWQMGRRLPGLAPAATPSAVAV